MKKPKIKKDNPQRWSEGFDERFPYLWLRDGSLPLETYTSCEEDVKEFIQEALTSAKEEAYEEMRIVLIGVLDEVEKEHGSPSAFLDMVEELFTEKVDTLK